MNKFLEALLIALALAGMYSAMPNNSPRPQNSAVRAEQAVLVADGTDPMPLCRKHAQCGP